MDPLSLSCNIIGVLTISGKLLSFGYSYGNSVKDFPEDLQDLTGELSSLSGILHALKVVMDSSSPDDSRVASAGIDPNGVAKAMAIPMEHCERLLLDIVGYLEKEYQKSASKTQGLVQRLSWPLKESKIKGWIERIRRYKNTFSLALSADEVSLTRAIRESLEQITIDQQKEIEENRSTMQKERSIRVLQWLSTVDSEPNHRAAQNLRQLGTGRWLTRGKEFKDWLNAEGSFLWLYGMPGTGKTILASHIIDQTLAGAQNSPSSDIAVAYFYCDFQERIKQTTAGLLGSILAQLLIQLQKKKIGIPEEIQELYQRRGPLLDSSSVEGLQKALPSVARQFSKVILIIDALDECTNRMDFFREIKWFRTLEKVNLLVTSREEFDIKFEFEGLPSLMINPTNIAGDIEMYIINEIERQPKLQRLKQTMKSQIIRSLMEQADGMFRWVSCCLDQIGKMRSDRAIKATLVSLPRTLEGTYERILSQILKEDEGMAIGVLRWLVYNWSPMTLDQIMEGIAVEIGKTTIDHENKSNDPEDIMDVCRGLISMDNKSRKLRLAHFTVKEYLVSTDISQGPVADYYMPPGTSNAELTKVCLTYLMFDDFGAGACPTMEVSMDRHERYPLYGYAADSLYFHISDYTKNGADETLDKLLLQFFLHDKDFGNFAGWSQANMGFQRYLQIHPKKTPLYCASILGLNQVVVELLGAGADVNEYCGSDRDFSSQTSFRLAGGRPLIGAIIGGHEDTVRLLLENGANPNLPPNPNEPSSRLGVPIFAAGSRGSAKCLQVLMDHGADEEIQSGYGLYGETIQMAAWNAHQETVEVLIKTKQFQTASNCDGITMRFTLFQAAEAGFDNAVRMLLGIRGDIPVSPDCEIFPMIMRVAAQRGRFNVIRAMLQNSGIRAFCLREDFFPNFLLSAAYGGEAKVVELLLNARKNLSARDFGSSLHAAAAKGQASVIGRLLQAGASPCAKDSDGWTPILCAAQYQQEHCMEVLSKGVDNWDVIDNTPICWKREGVPLSAEISQDGLEIKNAVSGSLVTVRAQRPTTPLCERVYFEIQVISCSPGQSVTIGFGDKLVLSSWNAPNIWHYEPGQVTGSWGYRNNGPTNAHDTMDALRGHPYGTGAIVGCSLDRKSKTAVFTLNGLKSGMPFADVKGKLFPIVSLGPGTHIRANFGEEPFVYGMLSLSAEEIRDATVPLLMKGVGY